VGKTEVGILLGKALQTEVLTADSRQVYRGMDIGTDKPTLAEQQGVPHRLIDLVNPDEPFNTGLYRQAALKEIERLYAEGRIPLVVGGTGLYIRVLLRGLWDGPPADWAFRQQLMVDAARHGHRHLHDRLKEVDPVLASTLHFNDHVKIIRGLEVYQILGRPLSSLHQEHVCSEQAFTPLYLGINRERDTLYRRVERRVDIQLEKGLVQETQALLAQGYGRERSSMKGLGYKEIAGYLDGEYSYAEAITLFKRNTRHFVKRQLTWFRRESGLTWLMIEEGESAAQVADRILEQVAAHRQTEWGPGANRAVPHAAG
jgi:tRNA dimethylallyltransferase